MAATRRPSAGPSPRTVLLVAIVLSLSSSVAISSSRSPVDAYSGEDLLEGNPWYHPAFTYVAADQAGFSPAAGASLAWHADYIDSYAYNPLWWFQAPMLDLSGQDVAPANRPVGGALDRYISSLAVEPDLVKLHFDDHYYTGQIDATWYRYFAGTIAGLVRAAENGDVAAAHHLLGVSLHAVQDFYAHSSWMDEPERRDATWLELTPQERLDETVMSGTYEERDILGYPHGKPSIECTIMRTIDQVLPLSGIFDVACGSYSPLNSMSICETFRNCCDAQSAPPTIGGVQIPSGVYYSPPGVALDNRSITAIGARERGLIDDDGDWVTGMGGHVLTGSRCTAWLATLAAAYDEYNRIALDTSSTTDVPPCGSYVGDPLFATSTRLATETSEQWLELIEDVLVDGGFGDFWRRVSSESSLGSGNTSQFEEYSRFPFQFLTAGAYPPPDDVDPAVDEYYLRVTLRTSGDDWAGTDGDVHLLADGRDFVLDYTPTTGINLDLLFAHDDFERGNTETFVVGPFANLPTSFSLVNHVPTAGEVLERLWDDTVRFFEDLWDGIRDSFIGINSPDHIGDLQFVLWPRDLADLDVGGSAEFTQDLTTPTDGGYRVRVRVTKTGETGVAGTERQRSTYRLELVDVDVLAESTELSPEDELFLFSLFQGTYDAYFPGGYGYYDVDAGDTVSIGHLYPEVSIGAEMPLSLYLELWESDWDDSTKRREMYEEGFLGMVEQETDGWLELLAMQIGGDWKLGRMTVEAFSRSSETVRYGVVFDSSTGVAVLRRAGARTHAAARRAPATFPLWIDARSTASFGLAGADALRTVDIAGAMWVPPEPSPPEPPPAGTTCQGRTPTILGGDGDDTIVGTSANDVIWAGPGDDVVEARGNDVVCLGPGADTAIGGSGSDRLDGGPGPDTLIGGPGPDALVGGPGADVLRGSRGADRLAGGGDDDVALGGPGRDAADGGPGVDACRAESETGCERDTPIPPSRSAGILPERTFRMR